MRLLPLVSIALALTACAGVTGSGTAPLQTSAAGQLDDGSSGDDWPGFGRTYGEQHYSPLDQINSGNAAGLGLAWFYDLPPGNSVSAPVAAKGVVYTATGYSVVRAISAETGRLLWEYDPYAAEAAGPKLRNGWGIRGLAWWNDKLYVGTQDGRLIAIDAASGKPVWSAMTLDKDSIANISGAPRIFDGKVIIGFGGADYGAVRGYVSAYDAETGKFLWRFYTVPGNPADGFEDEAQAMAAKTWSGDYWKYGGGTVWNAMSYDPETDTVFIGTGNGSPWNKKIRSPGTGDDLFLCSIVALDAKTGKYKWHYQVNPGETWDYNAVMDMPLATLTIDGRPRKVIMQAPKNGFFYVIDRLTGKLISAEPFTKVNWASKIDLATGRPVETPGARFENGASFLMWPSPAGGHNWQPMSVSPKTGLVYIPTVEMAAVYSDKGIDLGRWVRRPGSIGDNAVNLGYATPDLLATAKSFLQAWDPVRQKQVWQVPTKGVWAGGTMATGGGLVFQGQADGRFSAYDAATGKTLWSFDAKAPVLAPPISYRYKGVQYVTVLTGIGGHLALLDVPPRRVGVDYGTAARRVLTFALGRNAALPAAPEAMPVAAQDDPDFKPDAKKETRGLILFHQQCVGCHGIEAVGNGSAPDLRGSAMPLSAEAFAQVVHEGALVPNGMPRFDQLDAEEIEAIRQYLRSRAHQMTQAQR